jgi:Tol biopolymer transport system component
MEFRIILAIALTLLTRAATAEGCNSLSGLGWLLGQWRSVNGDLVTTEAWERVSAKTFEGIGEVRALADGRLQSRETLRLVEMSGAVFLVAKVAHNDCPVGFRLADCSAETAVFENPGHDFPTRIAYRLESGDRLSATVSGAGDDGFSLVFERQPRSWSPGDSDLVFSANRDGNLEIYLLTAGAEEWINLTRHPAADNWPVWSPDGRRIAFQSRRNGKFDIFVMAADGTHLHQLTDHPEHDYLPAWTPDGSRITFTSWRSEPGDESRSNHVYIMNADGSDQRRLLPQSPGTSAPVQWAPGGEHMVRTQKRGEQGADVFLADARGLALVQLTDEMAHDGSPAFSPDGARIAFHADRGDSSSLEVISIDGSGRRSVLAAGRNYYPRWSPDGCWLAYSAVVDPESERDIDVRAIRVDGTGGWQPLVSGPGREGEASWRPSSGVEWAACGP